MRKGIEKILENGPEDTLRIMQKLKQYRDCPTTQQLASLMSTYFDAVGETKSASLGNYNGNVKVWTLRGSKQKA